MQGLNIMASKPWLIYAYPWQPYPRRLIIYLRERAIPPSLVTIVPVSDVQSGDKAPDNFPPRPPGSLPILMIPSGNGITSNKPIYIKQSIAIMEFLDDMCWTEQHELPPLDGHPSLPLQSFEADFRDSLKDDRNSLLKARHSELLSQANGLTESWNSIRIFGSGAGTIRLPGAAHEMFKWLQRGLLGIERWMEENDYRPEEVRWDGNKRDITIAEIVLFQFFEFAKDCYGVDMTESTGGMIKDAYGRDVRDTYPRLKLFYDSFLTRPSARRDANMGEMPPQHWVKNMTDWSPGVFLRDV
ncbi:hypothetical protein N7528_001335 [Penicillium herquei]|nr:hypothetical protein N7528_001335 [Penicillium herquei]